MMRPSAVAKTGVPCGAGMSIASCVRPMEHASLNVSRNCSGRTPATGIKSEATGALGEGCALAEGCGEASGWLMDACGVGSILGCVVGDGEAISDSVAEGTVCGLSVCVTALRGPARCLLL